MPSPATVTPRGVETAMARFTLAALAVFPALETWLAWPDGLTDPFRLVDAAGFGLLLWGALASLRARPAAAPGVLCAGWAWTVSSGWRTLALHAETLRAGGPVDAPLVWLRGLGEMAAVVGLALLLLLVVEARRPPGTERRRDGTSVGTSGGVHQSRRPPGTERRRDGRGR